MSLIIAIEPDRDQAAHLKDLVRRHTGAELILADNTAGAIDAIETHVPDLVLIPAFLSPEDDEALTNALRVTEAAHVQTLTIPVLGEPQQRSALGVLSRLRRDSRQASPDSCDPRLFAEQITEYLERVAKERGPIAGTNGKGSPGSNGSGGKTETPPPAEKPKPAVASKPAATSKVVSPPPQPEPAQPPSADIDVSALEEALSGVELEARLADASMSTDEPESMAADDLEGLEEGLSSLMEKLTVEESAAPASAPASINATDWAELKQLESVEYAIPSIAPRDENAAAVNTAPPQTSAPPEAAAATPAAAKPAESPSEKKSEWGDLMDSLKKDLGR